MSKFVECDDCGFTLLADESDEPVPKRVEVCPGCESDQFTFPSDN